MCFLTERNESSSFCVYKRTCRNCHQTHRTWSTTWCCQFCKLILSHYDYSEHNLASFDSLIVYCFLSYARFFFIIWSRLHGVRSTTCFWVVGFFARSMNIYVCLPSWPKNISDTSFNIEKFQLLNMNDNKTKQNRMWHAAWNEINIKNIFYYASNATNKQNKDQQTRICTSAKSNITL